MILFLYGQDTYGSRQKLNEIIEHFKEIHGFGLNLKYFDDPKINFQEFKDEIQTTSMFKEKKLIVLTNIFSDSETEKEFLGFLKKKESLKDIILFYEKGKVDGKKSLFKFLKKQGKAQEFKLLEGRKLRDWIRKEFKKYQIEIVPEALEIFIEFIGNDLWRLSNEIKKLAVYKIKNPELKISIKDINLLTKPKIETDIFDTIDSIASKNKKRALNLLHYHLEKGDSPFYLFSMIKFQISNLLVVKDLIEKQRPFSDILAKTGLHPFVVKKSYWLSQRFRLEELKKIYRKIFQLELKIKTGKIEPALALDLLVTEM